MKPKLQDKYLSQDVEWVAVTSIFDNTYNPNYMTADLYNALKDDIRQNGLEYPIMCRFENRNVVDGSHRFKACRELGWKNVPVTWRKLTDEQAKIRTLNVNRERGVLLPDLTGDLLKDLTVTVPQDILAKLTHIPKDDMNLLLDLSFDPQILPTDTAVSNIMSWSEVDSNIAGLVSELSNVEFDTIVYLGDSGMIPARLLADRMGKKLVPFAGLNVDDNCIIVDDLYDTGKKFKSVMKVCKDKKIPYVVITAKRAEKYPDNLIYSFEDEDEEYLVYPWNKFQYRKGNTR